MSFENSPSLDDFKEGLPVKPPDSSVGKRRMRISLGILSVVALLLVLANFLQTDTAALIIGTGSVKGIALETNGAPFIGRAFIVGVDKIVTTSSDGSFLLDGIPAGAQTLVVADLNTGNGYPVKVVAGQTINVGQVQFVATALPNQ
jgi:hypothetical protein